MTDPKSPRSWHEGEQELGISSHSTLGQIIATYWGFPKFVVRAAQAHHLTPAEISGEEDRITRLAALANCLSLWAMGEPHRIEEDFQVGYARLFGLDERGLEKLVADIGVKVA